jgi:hypothetical protein
MGKAAAEQAAQVLRETLRRQGQARVIVASAPSLGSRIGQFVAAGFMVSHLVWRTKYRYPVLTGRIE